MMKFADKFSLARVWIEACAVSLSQQRCAAKEHVAIARRHCGICGSFSMVADYNGCAAGAIRSSTGRENEAKYYRIENGFRAFQLT